MDGITFELPVFLVATFAGAFVAGLSGFAFGLVAASLWLYILSPVQSATLIVAFGLLVQGYSVWKLRAALDWAKLWPFITTAVIGVPLGVTLLAWSDARSVRIAVGTVLIFYSLHAFFRPALKFSSGGRASDASIGFLSGVLGGLTGLAGILVTIWCNLRGWPKDAQRAVFQPVAVAIFLMSALWLAAKGTVTAETAKFFVMGLPCALAGTWLGLKLFGRIHEPMFRKIVLVLLLVSGVTCCSEAVDFGGRSRFIRDTGAAIPPRGDMPKNRVLFFRKDAACLPIARSPLKSCLA